MHGFEQLPKEHEGGFKSNIPKKSRASYDSFWCDLDMTFPERSAVQCSEAMAYIIYEASQAGESLESTQDGNKAAAASKLRMIHLG